MSGAKARWARVFIAGVRGIVGVETGAVKSKLKCGAVNENG